MRRRVANLSMALTMILALATPAGGPAVLAQPPDPPGGAPPQMSPPSAPVAPPEPDALVVSLQDILLTALKNNLAITIQRFEPLKSESRVALAESAFDPSLLGSARSYEDEQKRVSAFIGPYESREKSHLYSASYLDPVSIGGQYSVTVGASDDFTRTSNIFGVNEATGYNTNWQVGFTQPLLRNLGRQTNTSRIVIARNDLSGTEEQFRQTVLDTLAVAEKGYWDLTLALMNLETSKASLKLAQDFLEQNKIKVRVGTLAPIEITQAEAEVASREETVILAAYGVATSEDNMRQITNVPHDSPVWTRPVRPADQPSLVEVYPVEEEAVRVALANRPDLRRARLEIQSRENDLAYRKNLRRWGLDFTGYYGNLGFNELTYSNSIDDLRDRNQTNWNLELNLTIPLGNRAAVSAYTEADFNLTQARYRLQQVQLEALVEVRNAVRQVQTNLKRIKAAQVNVRLQKEKLDAEQKKFENGMSTSFQVLTFQTDLTTAVFRESQALADYNKSLAELERVKGTLLAARSIELPPAPSAGGAAPGGAATEAPAPEP